MELRDLENRLRHVLLVYIGRSSRGRLTHQIVGNCPFLIRSFLIHPTSTILTTRTTRRVVLVVLEVGLVYGRELTRSRGEGRELVVKGCYFQRPWTSLQRAFQRSSKYLSTSAPHPQNMTLKGRPGRCENMIFTAGAQALQDRSGTSRSISRTSRSSSRTSLKEVLIVFREV